MSKSRSSARSDSTRDEQFEAFLKESMSSSESSFDVHRLQNKKQTETRSQFGTIDDDDDDDTSSFGLALNKKSFLKSDRFRRSQSPPKPLPRTSASDTHVSVSRDSLEEESFGNAIEKRTGSNIPGLALDIDSSLSLDTTSNTAMISKTSIHPGKDTLDEMADKERFFRELREKSNNTVDVNRLIREQIGESETFNATEFQRLAGAVMNGGMHNGIKPVNDAENKAGNMLSQVALLDSLDSTFEKDAKKPQQLSRTSEDMRTIPEMTGEQKTGTSSGHHDDSGGENADDQEEEVEEEEEEESDGEESDGEGQDDVDGHRLLDGVETGTTYNGTRNEDDSTDHRVSDTTTKGNVAKTISGLAYTDTSHDMEAIRQEMRKLGTFSTTTDLSLRDSAIAGTGSHRGSVADTGTRPKTLTDENSATNLNKLLLPVSDSVNKTSLTGDAQPRRRQLSGGQQPQQSVRFNDEAQEYSQSDTINSTDERVGSPDFQSFKMHVNGHDLRLVDDVDAMSPAQLPLPLTGKGRPTTMTPLTDSRRPSKDPRLPIDRRSRDKYANVKSSGYSHRAPANKLAASKSEYSPAPKSRPASSRVQRSEVGPSSSSFFDSHLSNNSTMITSNDKPLMASSPARDDLQRLPDELSEERRVSAKLRATVAVIEKEHAEHISRLKTSYEKQLSEVQKENYVLAAKVSAHSESEQRLKLLSAVKQSDIASHEQLAQLERDIRQQETLLTGYQTENERLCEDMKRQRAASKATEEKMFKENHKLKVELANTREELQNFRDGLRQREGEHGSAALGAGRIAQLESELRQARAREESCRQELELSSLSSRELVQKINDLKVNISDLETELKMAKSQQSKEAKDIGDRWQKEVETLKKKLKWYAENQQLLDKDASLLKQKDDEIARLTRRLDELHTDSGRKQSQIKTSQNERSVQAKRIMDLERQVKEMENILKKRHPNSLPVLMWAAANAPDDGTQSKPASVEYLEGRIKKLEAELEAKDEEAKRSLRAMEQKYTSMKLRYEERVQVLETAKLRLEKEVDEMIHNSHPHSNQMALHRELESVKDRHRKQIVEYEQMINELRQELVKLRSKELAHGKAERQQQQQQTSPSVASQDITADQTHEEKLILQQRTIEQLEKEKQELLNELRQLNNKAKSSLKSTFAVGKVRNASKEMKKPLFHAKHMDLVPASQQQQQQPPPSLSTDAAKQYSPDMFADQHVSEILAENTALKARVEALELDLEQQKVYAQRLVAEAEAKERCVREDTEERINVLTNSHRKELQQLLMSHSAEVSTSKVAELTNKVSTQEVIIHHLKQQFAESRVDGERLAALGITQVSLETRIKELTDELCEARSAHTPQMRHFEALQQKIVEMETRHRLREQQLQQLMQQQNLAAAQDAVREVARWRSVVDTKNHEIDRFRTELDDILSVLRQLQTQGVIVPYRDSAAILNAVGDNAVPHRT